MAYLPACWQKVILIILFMYKCVVFLRAFFAAGCGVVFYARGIGAGLRDCNVVRNYGLTCPYGITDFLVLHKNCV